MSSADALARPSTSVWRAWLQMARVSNTPTTVSNTVAGAVLVSTTAPAGTVAVVAVAIALFYTAGMILNDVFDEEIDRRERPERPLPSGVVSRQAALLAVVVLFVAGELLLALEGWRPVVAGLGLIGLIVLYDAWHKGNALSPLLMAACRLMVYVDRRARGRGRAEHRAVGRRRAAVRLRRRAHPGRQGRGQRHRGALAGAGRARAGRVLGQGAAGSGRRAAACRVPAVGGLRALARTRAA